MVLPANMAKAVYNDPGIEQYRGNPLIEALLLKSGNYPAVW